ncbi:Pentatricopeptide repeat-containing protein [Acorus calamus]|uniref:Pentatricopeptide repeat-containing protein n=1 Tax=Acorus calamus TaxID=4465 RepID=A0AAV9D6W9_ACOCL|nr:Pentatricopeptide repeat-containing protein [Acorus calamus]
MPNKTVACWSTMIHGYAINGYSLESLRLFKTMQALGLPPNSFTFVGVLAGSTGLGSLNLARCVHACVLKNGLVSHLYVGTALLDNYAKCGSVGNSYEVFKGIEEPGLVSYSAMITAFIDNRLFEDALSLFGRIRSLGLAPNSITMLSIVRGCASIGSIWLCENMHGYIVKLGLDLNASVMNSVLDMYISFDDFDTAVEAFEKMTIQDVISWTSLMRFLVQNGRAREALKMFSRMRIDGVNPDALVMVILTTACALLGDSLNGRLIHSQIIVCGLSSELPITNTLIAFYSKSRDLRSARATFDSMVEKSLVSWTAMINGCVQNRQPCDGMKLLIMMRREEDFEVDSVLVLCSLMACAELAVLELGEQLHAYIFKAGFCKFKLVQNSLVTTYSKCGHAKIAHRVFREMDCQDNVSWNAIISGYGFNGDGASALALFHDMERSGEETDERSYTSVLSACSHSGLADQGMEIFNHMLREGKVRPSAEHYGCVVDMLARAGRFEEAKGLVNSISLEGIHLDAWMALLGGCRIHDEVGLAELAADRVIKSGLKDAGHVVLLSNLYASIGRFEEVEMLRSNVRMKGLVKEVGRSTVDAMPLSVC